RRRSSRRRGDGGSRRSRPCWTRIPAGPPSARADPSRSRPARTVRRARFVFTFWLMDTPALRPVPRTMGVPLALTAAFIVVTGALLAGRKALAVEQIVTPIAVGLFALGAGLSWLRAREEPAEARGWRFIAGARAVLALAGVFILASSVGTMERYGGLGVPLVDNALIAAGLWEWPWRKTPPIRRLPHVLGSFLFIGSVIFLLWFSGTWSAGVGGDPFIRLLLVGFGIHVAVVGGIGFYLVSQAPCRMGGPLGWIMAGVVASAFVLGLLQSFSAGSAIWGPLFAVLFLGPIGYILAAWCRRPV